MAAASKSKVLRFLVILMLVAVMTYAAFVRLFSVSYPFNVPVVREEGECIPTRRTLAKRILSAQRQIAMMRGEDGMVDAALLSELLALAAELDPRISLLEEEKVRNYQLTVNPTSQDAGDPANIGHLSTPQEPQKLNNILSFNYGANINRNVCPEKYRGKTADFTLQTNFVEVKCTNIPKFRSVLSIVLSTKEWDYSQIESVIRNIRIAYDVDIFVLTYSDTFPGHIDISNTFIKQFDTKTHESFALNQVISNINTPYVLVSDSFTHFSNQSSLRRLVRVLDDLENVDVAAGAYRDLEGNWNHGCFQHTLENYQLSYVHGYQYSKHECMYCEDVLGPFITRTEFLKDVPFMDAFEGPLMFRDWFLTVRVQGRLVMACPDVMFFVETEPVMTAGDWLKLSQKWSLQSVKPFVGEDLQFTCEEVNISCVNLQKTVESFLLPPCCIEGIRKELAYVQECAEEMGLYYELQSGTNLGAVKMHGILPWDFDTDVYTDCKDQQTWLTKGMECMGKKGCRNVVQFGNYWVSICKFSTIDISCRYNVTTCLPPEYRHIPTKVRDFDGKIANVQPNPGLMARNKYGPEYLKHAVHWRYSNPQNPNPIDDGKYPSGLWSPCKEPGFHACLDHFPVDGNMKFKKLNDQLP